MTSLPPIDEAFEPVQPVDPSQVEPLPKDTFQYVSPPKSTLGIKHSKHGTPQVLWPYHDAAGQVIGYACRWDISNGVREKLVLPAVFGSLNGDKPRWHFRSMPRPHALYNLNFLAADPTKPVLIVEGEKAADAAQYLFPDFTATTSPGGTGQFALAEWVSLKGRDVVIWPDNDIAGAKYAADVSGILHGLASTLSIVRLPRSLPDKWDLADTIPSDLTPTALRGLLDAALKPNSLPEEPIPDADEGRNKNDGREYVYLGHLDQRFYFFSKHSNTVLKFSSRELSTQSSLNEIVPNIQHWRNVSAESGWYDTGSSKPDYNFISAQLIKKSYESGDYDAERGRGRGAWHDEGRVIVHTGRKIIVDGAVVKPVEVDSRHIYASMPELIDGLADPLSNKESRRILDVCRMINWTDPLYGDLFAGWMATAMVCGALPWRSHIWLCGNSGVGKSTLTEKLIGPILGNLAIWPLGASTEAGIRRWLGLDARPVVFDEAETRGGAFGEERRRSIMEFIRQASSEGRGRIVKGAGSGVVFSQSHSQFCLSSIGVGLSNQADDRRMTVLSIEAMPENTTEQRAASEASYKRLLKALSNLPPDTGHRLFSRMVQNIDNLLESIRVLSEVFSHHLGGRPIGDKLGPLLAGAWILQNTRPITPAMAKNYVEMRDWSEFSKAKEVKEDAQILRQIMGFTVTIETADGRRRMQRTVGELCALCADPYGDPNIERDDARRALLRLGIKWDPVLEKSKHSPPGQEHVDGFFFAAQSTWIRKALSDSDGGLAEYADGWHRILRRGPGVVHIARRISFGFGVSSAAEWVPAALVLGTPDRD